jgi:pimeloyl-ACP methyl ester carboxylesterase
VPEPCWIGSGAAALFGFLHTPSGTRCRSTAVVIVPPLGYEAICAHAALRRLAERIAETGFFVLRYDHPNSGDSAGEGCSVLGLADGLSRAIAELRARSGATHVALVGLRLGALLALEAARDRPDVVAVVTWAPPPTGRAYVRELRALGNFSDVERQNPRQLEEIAGFAYSPETLADLGRLDPRSLTCPAETSILVVPRDDVAIPAPERLGPWASRAEVRALPGYAEALRDPHEACVSEALLDGVAGWLAEKLPEFAPLPERAAPEARIELGSVVEEAVSFGAGARLFGIVTRPRRAAASGPCVLFLNAGAIHRIGMNRNYVTLARDWAKRGVTCLRFDGAGLGDSPPHHPGSGNVLYSRETVADVKSAIDFLSERYGATRFVLAGLCAGAYAAFHTALADPRVDTAFIINPQTFDFKPGDSLSIQRRRAYRAASWYRRSALKAESWRKALRGQVDLVRVGRVLAARLALYAERRLNGTDSLARALGEICRRGTRVLLVYSADDPGLEHLRDELGSALERLKQDPSFALEVIEGADHTFTPLASQENLARCLEGYLTRWHAAAAA